MINLIDETSQYIVLIIPFWCFFLNNAVAFLIKTTFYVGNNVFEVTK